MQSFYGNIWKYYDQKDQVENVSGLSSLRLCGSEKRREETDSIFTLTFLVIT